MRETVFGHPDDRDIGETGPVRRKDARTGDLRSAGSVLGSITLPRRAAEVATARRFVARTLGDRPEIETVLLLTSEAVTNSVIHTAGATVTVVVLETATGLRLEVTDCGADTVPTVRDGCDLREDGRGVLLVQRLSARSGFHADESGLTYWFEL
jgi:anti-sigma regulatory factor (Ser/Thr protein kinase)